LLFLKKKFFIFDVRSFTC